MKTVIAAACLVALAGIMLLLVIGPSAEAEAAPIVQLSDLPEAANPPEAGRAEAYRELLALRMARIADLEKYAAAGVFPINETGVEFTPVFVDELGTACAVGHLMRCAGALNLVDQIALNNNLVKLHEVNDGPVVAWILHSGLTKEECELIQPNYDDRWPGHGGRFPGEEPADPEVDARLTAVRFIRDHLESTARLLRKSTAASLEIALRRLGGEFEILEPASGTTRVFRNDDSAALLARASTIESSGELGSVGTWREVAPGTSFKLGNGDARQLLETVSKVRP